ncbi:MAG TPA: FAD-binding oxidoreductase [Tepidisphaeraceae bacterium]|jgi:hypothetical protein|nr:FAD-binding oxidoreductase [Tepidisphaeraceae bacterium]
MQSRLPHRELASSGKVVHHISDLTATIAADVPLAQVQETLGEQNQWLPIDGDGNEAVGRLVDVNSTGPLRLGYGAWRDLLLGVQFISGRGELVTAGGQTMKNVAGYDLTKLMVGATGCLGRIVTITTRTYRRPTAAVLATFSPDIPILNSLMATPARPQWSVLTKDALLCGYVGDRDTILFYLKDLPKHDPLEIRQHTFEEDCDLRARLWRSPAVDPQLAFRASAPPSRLYDLIRALKPAHWIADPAFGILLGVCPSKAHINSWQALAAPMSARIVFRHPTSQALVNYSTSPEEKRIIDLLKRAFDPRGQLPALSKP